VADKLKEFFSTTKRIEKANGKLIMEKVVSASRTRISARAHKDLQRRKNALESSSLPTKLADCRSEDVTRTELFIVEGDSALGTTKAARNSEFQAILPIRGKILNVQKASLSQMLDNSECASIIQVLGAGSGKSFELEDARYGRLILMSDADVDGAHIRCLLLTLLYRYMRPMIDSGRVFAAIPPLHRIETMGGGGKKGEYIYTYSDDEMKKVTAELTKAGKKWKEPIQRYKGLGEMDADQLRETTMDPDARTLRRITVSDASAAEKMFELLMGNDVAPRKEFISTAEIDRDRIDA
jgi:DNA gyrase subunit B